MIDHFGQVGMGEVAQDLGFPLELALGFGGSVQVLFQCAGSFQVQVPGTVDRAKTSLPYQV